MLSTGAHWQRLQPSTSWTWYSSANTIKKIDGTSCHPTSNIYCGLNLYAPNIPEIFSASYREACFHVRRESVKFIFIHPTPGVKGGFLIYTGCILWVLVWRSIRSTPAEVSISNRRTRCFKFLNCLTDLTLILASGKYDTKRIIFSDRYWKLYVIKEPWKSLSLLSV